MTTTRAIQAVLFDFGNVLATFDHLKACTWLAQYSSLPLVAQALKKELWGERGLGRAFELGRLTPGEFYSAMVDTYRLTVSRKDFETHWGDIFTDGGVQPVLRNIPSFVKKGILSNTDPVHWQHICTMPVVHDFFVETYLTTSFHIGRRKPDAELYAKAARKFDLVPQQIVFIDDIRENVEAAKRLGFYAEKFHVNEGVKQLEKKLDSYGML